MVLGEMLGFYFNLILICTYSQYLLTKVEISLIFVLSRP